MKSILYIFLFCLFLTQFHYSQWTNQNPVPDVNDLWSTFFVDDSTGWIVGSGGFIKKTTNAGNEWIQQYSSTTLILKSVQFADRNTGWICGEAWLILKTTDGGTNWDSLASGTTQHLSDIHFYDADTGYVAGFNGTILKTTNGGLSWISLFSGTTNDLYSMDFVDAFIGYAAGEVNDTSSVIKTTDGGVSWIDKSGGFPVTSGSCLTVEFIDANTGFIGGGDSYSFLYKTSDGGNTWGGSLSPLKVEQTEKDNNERLSVYPYPVGINSIYFRDINNGWYVRWSSTDNYIHRTTDGGITWEYQRNLWERALLSVFVTQDGKGLAVGTRGLIYLKAQSDSDWSQLLSGSYENIQSIYFFGGNIGWAGGTRWGNPYKGVIYKTTNGGKQWKTQLQTGISSFSRCFYFINESLGWLAKSNGVPQELTGAGIYRTTDGGENWISVHPAGDFSSLFFINQDTGWVTSDYGSSSSYGIYKSIDGGVILEKKSSVSSSSIYFSDFYNGWAVGLSGILKSTDGGETWITKSSSAASYVRFYNSNVGMCVSSGAVLVSTDGGETWTTKSSPSLQTINFINPVTVWGYTSEGTLYKTTNLGDTWEILNTGLGSGETAFFINEYMGWVGGLNGTMFKYSIEPPKPPVWSNQIAVKDAGGIESSQVLTFGQHIDATDSIDTSLGEYEIPPPPPSGIFDVRFNLPTYPPPIVSSLIDYRDSAKTDIVWDMTFQPRSGGYPMMFGWDSTSFPQGTFYLKDRINGSLVNVNMKNQSSYVLTNPVITSLSINYRGASSIVDVNNGWNIISVPLIAEDMSLSNLYPTATSLAYRYDGGYFSEDTLAGGVGYWLKFDANEEIQIYGLTQGETVPLQEGWNMFGVYEIDIPVTQLTTTPPGIIATYFFKYDDGYYIADTLKSGQGFWVRVTDDGVLNLNGSSLEKDGEAEQFSAKLDQDWGRIKINDSKGRSVTLYATEEKTDLSLFDLPPLPPTGIFDVRYSNRRLSEDIRSEKIIQISSGSYPITIKAEGINILVRDRINGNLLNEVLIDGEEIKIMNSKITSIQISGKVTGGLPATYELFQNYPNPFNPTTKIKFAVPKESDVNLSIYNVLGELVTTLINGQMQVGYHEYDFNASKLSSGVYIYRIKAGDFVETKKMIVIK